MRLTTYTDYSLRVLMYLVLHPAAPVTVREIAESYDISRFHLMKVVQQLAREGFVDSLRGRSGGLRLAKPARDIFVGDVVRRMEDDWKIVECFGSSSHCMISPSCKLKGALNEALQAFLAVLDGYTLEDLCVKPAALLALFPDQNSLAKKKK